MACGRHYLSCPTAEASARRESGSKAATSPVADPVGADMERMMLYGSLTTNDVLRFGIMAIVDHWGSQGERPEVSPDRLLTAQDLADYLEVPVKTIYTWRHRNAGPRGFRIGRHLRFQWRDVQAWLRDCIAEDR